jgi:hypothetical protein
MLRDSALVEQWIHSSAIATGAGDTRYQVWQAGMMAGVNSTNSASHNMGRLVIPRRHTIAIVQVAGTDNGDAYTLVRGLFERIE